MHLSKKLVLKKVSVVLILVIFTTIVKATDYYISSSGNDNNNGLSNSSPWKTLNKVNTVFSFLKPGDRILFKRADLFYGTIKITTSGLSGYPITIGSYGTGGMPVITGSATLSSWTDEGNGIFSAPVNTESPPEVVTIDGIQFSMGRYPNSEFLKYELFSTNVSITDNELPSLPNWKGAEAVIKKTNWIMDRCLITNHSGSTITYRSLGTYNTGTKDYGYFFQNDIKTLDSFGEWYYNSSKLYIYFGTKSPADFLVKVSSVNNIINNSNGHNHIKVENLAFSGSIKSSVHISGSDYFVVQSCNIDFSGENGIYLQGASYFKADNNIISNSNRAGIYCAGGNNAIITNNQISNSGMILGGTNSATQNNGVYVTQNDNCLVQYNNINLSGGNGIYFTGNNVAIKNNFINNSSLILNDCAGIYTTGRSFSGRLIEGNIILNALGNTDGTPFPTRIYAEGIYIDAPTQDVDIINNTVAFCRRSGIFFHESHDNTCTGNTCFNNSQQIRLQFGGVNPTDIIRNIKFRDNILISKTPSFLALYASSSLEDIPFFLVSDLNYYARPVDDDDVFFTYSPSSGAKYRTLQGWQSFTGQDLHSGKSPVIIKDTADIDFFYNAAKTTKVIALVKPMIDVKGKKYYNSVTLEPYTSIILMTDPSPDQPVSPVFLSSVIQNSSPDKIEINYNVALAITSPPASSFTVKVNGVTTNVTNVVIFDTKIVLTLQTSVKYSDIVSLSYTQPESDKLQTTKGMIAENIPEQVVNNNLIDPDTSNKPPVIAIKHKLTTFSGFVYEIDASGTTDPDNDSITYSWKVPYSVPVSGTTGSIIKFLAPVVIKSEILTFILSASAGKDTIEKTIEINLLNYKPEIVSLSASRVSASSYYKSYHPGYVIDGNPTTRWSTEGDNQWLLFNLPSPCKISHLQVAFLTGQKYESYFDIYASKDNTIWDPVLFKASSCDFSGSYQIFDFPEANGSVEYSFLKLVGHGNSFDNWNNISELKIFGSNGDNDSKSSSYNSGYITLYPNPASESINVLILEPSSEPQSLKIYNSSGQLCLEQNLDAGMNYFRFSISLKPGIYVAKIHQSGLITHTQKLIVVHG